MSSPTRRCAIVTGASRGIGRAIAERLAQRGIDLLLNFHLAGESMKETISLCQGHGVKVFALPCDLRENGAGAMLSAAALDHFGRLDILINNAALMKDDLLPLLSDEDLQSMIDTNIAGMVRLTRSALRPMLRQRSGSIVNISSVLASLPGPGNAVYAGTKGFLESFTRALAVELGKKQIRVNAVAPGVVETDMSLAIRSLAPRAIEEHVAMRRFANPQEIADAVAFLASDEASYISGAVLAVDGGYG